MHYSSITATYNYHFPNDSLPLTNHHSLPLHSHCGLPECMQCIIGRRDSPCTIHFDSVFSKDQGVFILVMVDSDAHHDHLLQSMHIKSKIFCNTSVIILILSSTQDKK